MSKNDEEEILFKIMALGDSDVGKTSIIKRYCSDIFKEETIKLPISFFHKEIYIKNKKIKLRLIDIAGQEKYKGITKTYLKHCDAILFIFSLDNKISFDNIVNWIQYYKESNSNCREVQKYRIPQCHWTALK